MAKTAEATISCGFGSLMDIDKLVHSELNGDHGYLAMYASQRIPALPNRTKKKAEDDYFILGSDPCHRISGRNKNCPAPPGTGLLGYYFGAYLPL